MVYDAIVIGAGIVGAAVARDLAREGLSVAVVERHSAASGSSARGEGNILVSDKAPGPELDLALVARARWTQVADELRDELAGELPDIEFEHKGGVVVATRGADVAPLLAFAAAQRDAGVRCVVLEPGEALELEPHLNPAISAAVHYPDDAQVQPVIATEALLLSARRAGVVVIAGAELLGPVTGPGGILQGVQTSAGTVHAPVVINAAGPWSGDVGARLGAPIPVQPRRGVVLVTTRMPPRVHHKVYDADYVGAVGSDSDELQTSSVVESTRAGTVLIGSSRQRVGFADELRADLIGELCRKALLLFPFLSSASVMRSYSGFRPFTPDHLPLIGRDPRVEGLWHATGHEGAGVGLSLATSAFIADVLTGRPPAIDPFFVGLTRPGILEPAEVAS
ncbi:FAD-binding oxidoreductase [Microbacterium sp. SLBN-146]|uniref:NAD(P)/FAD-dependent oxidoreductase n=1 Tax=Microbacterium sp. SLBN-146 TaxID=2768457 RepID=UPI00116AF8A9|nr:FAD-dependent oxidoreductase [Microbacterium sp. SLBN-146]TQJ29878.1 glycine/D-amino acid oxidase-like deaminating enzyme [Microbacterium sp. SLBN-146]